MSDATPPTPAERFACLIAALCEAVAARIDRPARPGLAGPLILLIWTRLKRMAGRITRLAARVAAGPLPPPRRRPARPCRTVSPQCHRLPRRFAWLVRVVPAAAFGAGQLQALLAEPEMQTLIATAPQIGRTLRPLCRMLGVRLPPILQKPRPLPTMPRRAEAGRRPAAEPPRAQPPRPLAAPALIRPGRGPPVPVPS